MKKNQKTKSGELLIKSWGNLVDSGKITFGNVEGTRKSLNKIMRPGEYYSLDYLATKTKIKKQRLKSHLGAMSKNFRKSFSLNKKGEECYIKETRFGLVKDAWNAFCYFNYLKY